MCVMLSALPGKHLTILFLEPGSPPPPFPPPPAAVWLAAERLVPAPLLEPECSAVGAAHRRSLRFPAAPGPPGVPALDKLLQAARYCSSVGWGGQDSHLVTEAAGRVPSRPVTKDRFDVPFLVKMMKTFLLGSLTVSWVGTGFLCGDIEEGWGVSPACLFQG